MTAEKREKELDVIEAAESFMNWCPGTPEYERDYRLLEEAVDALQLVKVIEAAKEEAENTKRNGGWTPLLAAVEALEELQKAGRESR